MMASATVRFPRDLIVLLRVTDNSAADIFVGLVEKSMVQDDNSQFFYLDR